MLSLHTITKWMAGFFEPDMTYGLPKDVYDDAVPSGVHSFQRDYD